MGRNRNRNRNNKQNKTDSWGDGERQNWQPTEKKNEQFEKYYKVQGIVPEGEWDEFMEALRKPLPSTFRITGFKGHARQLLQIIKSDYFDNLMNIEVDGRQINPPKALPWYPDELAWQLDLDRKTIRQSNVMKKLHKFMIEETESGNISRQESVSMIPPLVMDIQPHHKVLDMCAAPGSKTAQMLELLHRDDKNPVPEGCVVANDSDNKRCYLMTHQVKRLATPSFMVINQDASCMPNFKLPNQEGHMKSVRFDRILADVPCSGDGTMRKNVDAWGKWNTHSPMHLHNLQSRILSRGLEMLAIGGRIIYSTCSMNPIEDEAVLCNIMRKSQGAVRIVDVSESLPGLKWVPGTSHWKVMSRDMETYSSYEDLPDRLQSTIRPSCFPPTEDEAKTFALHKCMRILPHLQDTGGFFVSVLEKTQELPWVQHVWKQDLKTSKQDNSNEAKQEAKPDSEKATNGEKPSDTQEDPTETGSGEAQAASTAESDDASKESDFKPKQTDNKRPLEERSASPPRKRTRQFGYKEDPFIFLTKEDPVWPPIQKFFELDNFPAEQLLVRCSDGKKRNIYFTSPIIKALVTHNETRIKVINLGLKILSRSDSPHVDCSFRTVQDGIQVLFPYVTRRKVEFTRHDLVTLLGTEMPFLTRFTKAAQSQLSQLSQGSVVFVFDPDNEADKDSTTKPQFPMILCGWLGRTSCRSFIPVNDRGHYMRMCGAELTSKAFEKDKRDDLDPDNIGDSTLTATAQDNNESATVDDDATETTTTVGEDGEDPATTDSVSQDTEGAATSEAKEIQAAEIIG